MPLPNHLCSRMCRRSPVALTKPHPFTGFRIESIPLLCDLSFKYLIGDKKSASNVTQALQIYNLTPHTQAHTQLQSDTSVTGTPVWVPSSLTTEIKTQLEGALLVLRLSSQSCFSEYPSLLASFPNPGLFFKNYPQKFIHLQNPNFLKYAKRHTSKSKYFKLMIKRTTVQE